MVAVECDFSDLSGAPSSVLQVLRVWVTCRWVETQRALPLIIHVSYNMAYSQCFLIVGSEQWRIGHWRNRLT